MDEYISRDDALLHSEIIRVYSKDYGNIDVVPVEYLADIPAADVQSVKRGKWDGYICSECNICADYFISGDFYFDEKPNFCPNCGARMDGDAE